MSEKYNNHLPSVLITGCSSGVGQAVATIFAKAGYPTYATARRLSSIDNLVKVGCNVLQLDVTDQSTIQQAVKTIEQKHGSIGILINNAAIGLMTPMETVSLDVVREQYETNVFGVLAITQVVIPSMRKSGKGRIVQLGSSGGEFTTPGGGVYQATKYALCSMSDALRMELKPFGIDVTMVQPGAIATKFASNGAVLGMEEGPYVQLMKGIHKVASAAVKPNAPGTWSPADIAKVVFKAGTKKRPKARYRPGIVAKLLIYLRLWLPYRVWDKMFIKQLMKQGQQQT
ncbi:MAG: SDR family NAD(P)-dependent oxidoreductase [Flavobacteriales bacterium]|nr:SDR family NAD(P)-dependent oxidoreductase [Flavobacteriales bacterium]